VSAEEPRRAGEQAAPPVRAERNGRAERAALAGWLAEAVLERKAEQVVALDVGELTAVADVFVLASGTSDRHVRALADAAIEAAKRRGLKALGVEGYEEGRWVLIDLNEAVVHLFSQAAREHYDLDRLWSDAPRLNAGAGAANTGPEAKP